jgi:hypothetical protein
MSKVFREGKFLCLYSTEEEYIKEIEERERLFREEIEEYKREKANGKISEHFSETDENDRESPSQEQFSEEDDRRFEQELPEWRDKENKLIDELEAMDKNKDKK